MAFPRRSCPSLRCGSNFGPALLSVFLLTLLTGVTCSRRCSFVLARPFFPRKRRQSTNPTRRHHWLRTDRTNFTAPGSLPSATLGRRRRIRCDFVRWNESRPRPILKLKEGASDDPKTADVDESFAGIRQLAEEYRKQNRLAADVAIPIDAVTRSGSGLDPHISPANAALQVARVSNARGMSTDLVRSLITKHTRGRQLGFLGEPRVAVLPLNLELDRTAPLPNPASQRSASRSESE